MLYPKQQRQSKRSLIGSTVLLLLLLVVFSSAGVNAQIGEQEDAGRVSLNGVRGGRGEVRQADTDVEGEEEEVPTLPPSSLSFQPWIYKFPSVGITDIEDMKDEMIDEGLTQEIIDIEGTKSFIIVYKTPEENELGISEETVEVTDATVKSTVEENGGTITAEYDTVLRGVAAELTNEALAELMQQHGIDYIEEDSPAFISQSAPAATWGLDRIDEPVRTSSRDYVWLGDKNAGAGVNAFVSLGLLT